MDSKAIRKSFLDFFEKRGHTIVPSSSLLPDDPSVLLTTAGMQQFKAYFIGKADPLRDFKSKSTASVQKSFRTSDIDEVGDESHLTFFEMMGNFSFGGYYKREAIGYAFDYFREVGVNVQYVTIFAGDDRTPRDEESRSIWQELGVGDIRELGREDNFWGPTGSEGPCGPTTEIFVDDVEIWNIVFNEYYCKPDDSLEKLEIPGVDTGMGLERLAVAVQKKKSIFETDLFTPLMDGLPEGMNERTQRIFADHARSVAFLIADGVRPSNKEVGYVLRRLMRRMIVQEYRLDTGFDIKIILQKVSEHYGDFYPELQTGAIVEEFMKENEKFSATLRRGLKELEKFQSIDAVGAFRLYESFGLPYEVIKEVGAEKANKLTREGFDEEFKKHQEKSRAGQEAKFGGHGLILDTGELKARDEEELKKVIRLHTATHLLQAALRKVLGEDVHQAGSDITAERLRFDFTFDRRLIDEEIKKVEDVVQGAIDRNLDMGFEEIPLEEAKKTGALYFEKEKYAPVVKVYSAVDSKTGEVFSRELCGGPHVEHTGEMGKFRITKQESVGAGVRRIRAIVE